MCMILRDLHKYAMQLIYKISFQNSDKVYIGKTANPTKRWKEHMWQSTHNSQLAIHRAIRKYGNPIFEIIASCIKDEYAADVEINIIKQYDSFHNGYNMTNGGEVGTGIGHPAYGKKRPDASERMKQYSIHNRGAAHHNANVWKLYFKDGTNRTIDNLAQWARDNGYKSSNICQMYKGAAGRKTHKDIIMVEKL